MLLRLPITTNTPNRRFREAPPLPQVQKSERACEPHTSEAITQRGSFSASKGAKV
jgi:hypothetical protein